MLKLIQSPFTQLGFFYLALLRKQGTWDHDTGFIHFLKPGRVCIEPSAVWFSLGYLSNEHL